MTETDKSYYRKQNDSSIIYSDRKVYLNVTEGTLGVNILLFIVMQD
jgi:hypothetical protein